MRIDENGGSNPNYFPNSFDNITPGPAYREPGMVLESNVADWFSRKAEGEHDHYSQPGLFWREVLDEQAKKNLVANIAGAINGIAGPRGKIINRQLCHFFRADIGLGMAIAKALGVELEDTMPKEHPQMQVSTIA
jgi:catalase